MAECKFREEDCKFECTPDCSLWDLIEGNEDDCNENLLPLNQQPDGVWY